MKFKLSIITSYIYVISLTILLINDFCLKHVFHNFITGKISDFSGLFAFSLFFTALFPNKAKHVLMICGILFVFWKSELSQPLIDFFHRNNVFINRVVDYSDLFALLVLPFAYKCFINKNLKQVKLNPVFLCCIALFAFTATSVVEPFITFKRPQYLLYKKSNLYFLDELAHKGFLNNSSNKNKYITDNAENIIFFNVDSFILMKINKIEIDKWPVYEDDYEVTKISKNILKYIDKTLCRNNKNEFKYFSSIENLVEYASFEFKTDSTIEKLNFQNGRLNGEFISYNQKTKETTKGKYQNGIETDEWIILNSRNEIYKKLKFTEGELSQFHYIKNKDSEYENTITRNKLIAYVISSILIFSLLLLLFIYLLINKKHFLYKKSTCIADYFLFKLCLACCITFIPYFFVKFIQVECYPVLYYLKLFTVIYEFVFFNLFTFIAALIFVFSKKERKYSELLWFMFIYSIILLIYLQIYYFFQLIR